MIIATLRACATRLRYAPRWLSIISYPTRALLIINLVDKTQLSRDHGYFAS